MRRNLSLLSMIPLSPAVSQSQSHPVLAAAQLYGSRVGTRPTLLKGRMNNGYIPNGAFTGNVSTNGNQGSVLSLLVDTGKPPLRGSMSVIA